MPDKIIPEKFMHDLVETVTDHLTKQNSGSLFEQEGVSSRFNRIFDRQKPIHHVLGGGRSADVLLWRNKKISAGGLLGATAIWVLFEWINFHFLTLLCFALVLGMLAQFIWANASGFINRSPSEIPRVVLPDKLFANIGVSIGVWVNCALGFLQDVSCGGNMKQFLMVIAGLWVAAVIGSWCNFLTVLYIGFIALHTLPVLYERNEDMVDNFLDNVIKQIQNYLKKLDLGVLSKIPKGQHKGKKHE